MEVGDPVEFAGAKYGVLKLELSESKRLRAHFGKAWSDLTNVVHLFNPPPPPIEGYLTIGCYDRVIMYEKDDGDAAIKAGLDHLKALLK